MTLDHPKPDLPRTGASRSRCARARGRLRAEPGFTLIEVMVAALILVSGLLTLLTMVNVANRTTGTNRVRQETDSLAREVVENARELGYTQLLSSALATTLQPQIPGATVSGTNLMVARNGYTFQVSFNVCSLDDASDGYGNHTYAPVTGGVWCPDVAASGTTDTNPDDYKRLSVTVAPTGIRTTPRVQQTILIYNRPTRGPAISCLSTTAACPGSNVTYTSGTAQAFNVTTTSVASAIEWLVNGNPPPTETAPQWRGGPVSAHRGRARPSPGTSPSRMARTRSRPAALTPTAARDQLDPADHPEPSRRDRPDDVQCRLESADRRGRHAVGAEHRPGHPLLPGLEQDTGTTAAQPVALCAQVHGLTCTDMTAPSPTLPPFRPPARARPSHTPRRTSIGLSAWTPTPAGGAACQLRALSDRSTRTCVTTHRRLPPA